MKSAAFVFHVDSTLVLKLFPAGKHNEIDWNHAAFSEGSLDFYDLKDSGTNEKSYVEYSPDNELNIRFAISARFRILKKAVMMILLNLIPALKMNRTSF